MRWVMLPESYEFHVDNQSGGSLTDVTIKVYPWKYGTSGELVYGQPIIRSGSMADAANGIIGTSISNTTDLHLGANVEVEFTGGGSLDAYCYFVLTGANQLTDMIVASTAPDGKDYQAEI